MKIPTLAEARKMLDEAEKLNPGPWIAHSETAAGTAKAIAQKCENLNPDTAYILGLLHDIGRREGKRHIKHIFDGYNFLINSGYDDAAVICLTHSFPEKEAAGFSGKLDCSESELLFLNKFLAVHEFDDYDRLIQLCDALSLPHGVVLMEKRLVDIVMRHGFNGNTIKKWNAFLELKKYFDSLAGCNIYTFLPRIADNTFGF